MCLCCFVCVLRVCHASPAHSVLFVFVSRLRCASKCYTVFPCFGVLFCVCGVFLYWFLGCRVLRRPMQTPQLHLEHLVLSFASLGGSACACGVEGSGTGSHGIAHCACGSHCNSRTIDGSLFAPSINSSRLSLPSLLRSIWRKILSVRFSGVLSSSGIFITEPTIL
uniref:Secreted protein n=1 Tax=Anopheles darlingi TaxID=43151 RepID=A0A2M4D4I8_ANODA